MVLDFLPMEVFCCKGFGKDFIIFGADMGSSVHIDKKRREILILGNRST